MKILLNGERTETEARTMAELVERLGLAPATLLIERNAQPLPREAWGECEIAEGDCVEMLRVAAGG
jgi:thiamine biosynthesis protein ThiS